MAGRLTQAGIAQADGFSLNVSNLGITSESTTYGKNLSSRTGGKHFVVDTACNGLDPSPDNQWCNPPDGIWERSPSAPRRHIALKRYVQLYFRA